MDNWNPITFNDLLMIHRDPATDVPPLTPAATPSQQTTISPAPIALPSLPKSAPTPNIPLPTTASRTSAVTKVAGGSNLGHLLLFPPDFMRLLPKLQTTTNPIDQMDWETQLEGEWTEARTKTVHTIIFMKCKGRKERDDVMKKIDKVIVRETNREKSSAEENVEESLPGGELPGVKFYGGPLPAEHSQSKKSPEDRREMSQVLDTVWMSLGT
jgi:hypothetical protein